MGEKTIKIFMIFIVAVYSFFSNYAYVEAKNEYTSQPAVCNGPSKTMSDYFDFQGKALKIILGSEVNSLGFSTSFENGWLFTDKVLTLPGTTAMDLLLLGIVGNTKSVISNAMTSFVLLSLISFSVIQSNTEGLMILWKDIPIVRDYKTMLDIETRLFDAAYFRSKQIDLSRPFNSDLLANLSDLIVEYQKKGLLETGVDLDKNETSMEDIIFDLMYMNTAMKHFILVGGSVGKKALQNYNGCLGKLTICEKSYGGTVCCNRENAVIKFSDEAIKKLGEDYKGTWTFGKCNIYGSRFKSTINQTINNNKESVKSAMNDITDSMKRLKGVFVSTYKTVAKKETNRCDLSDYEIAQLQAYWGGDWNCNVGLFNADTSISTVREYSNQKNAQREQKEKNETFIKEINKPESKDAFIGKKTTDTDILGIFEETMDEFLQAQENAISSDISDLLPRGKGILDQLDTTITNSEQLEKILKSIKEFQCSG